MSVCHMCAGAAEAGGWTLDHLELESWVVMDDIGAGDRAWDL